MLRILIIILFLSSCASKERTKYGQYNKKEGGYQERTLEDGLRIVRFKANSYTKKKTARKFAEFRAIEICRKENFRMAHLLDSFDKTESKTVRRSTSSGYPSYYYGMSPFYNRYSGFGYGFGFSTMDSSSWDETLQYPDLEVVFECANEVYEPRMEFREVSAEEMKLLVKDLRGALQVESIPKDSPNAKDFRKGDIILRGNGERVHEIYQLLSLYRSSKDHAIKVEVLRDGKLRQGLTLKGVDASEKILKQQKEIIKSVCKEEEVKIRALCKAP